MINDGPVFLNQREFEFGQDDSPLRIFIQWRRRKKKEKRDN